MRTLSLLATAAVITGGTGVLAVARSGDRSPASSTPAFAYAEPGIASNGEDIAFVSGGDIWSVKTTGGDARLLVADAANERRPLFSPDDRHLAFISTRTGGGDIYVLTFGTGGLRRITWDDGLEQLEGWSRDGRWLYFSSTSRDIAGMNDIYRVAADGGTPMSVSEERYTNEFGAAPSPDGRRLAFVARGISSSQWWRRGSSHIDQSEIWVMNLDGAPAYTQLSARDARQSWPMWSADGRRLFYVSDRGGSENLWSRPAAAGAQDQRITVFRDGRVLWPSITADGRTIAFEREFGIWTLDTTTGQSRRVEIARPGAATSPPPEPVRQATQLSDLTLAPDGRKVAFVARGDLFAASAKDDSETMRVTSTAGIESQPAWTPDSRQIAYVSARDTAQHLYLYDFASATETPLTTGAGTDLSPVFSPDGKWLAFLRDRRELHVMEIATRSDRLLAKATFADTIDSPKPAWSPDGRWIAVFTIGPKAFTNIELVPLGGEPMRPVTFLANVYANTMAWSPDGRFLLFDTRQRTENGQLARVDLTLRTPRFREDLLPDLFMEPRNPGTLDPFFPNIRERLSFLSVGLDVSHVAISPDGKTAIVLADAAGQTNLYAYPLDERSTERPVPRQITSTDGSKADPQFSADGREVYFLDGGRIQIATLDRRDVRPLAVTAEFAADFEREKHTVFDQVWTLLRDNFFDAGFNGVNWDASRERYGRAAAASSTPDELRRIISLMIGDLNASNVGISAPGEAPAIGRLGVRFDRQEYERAGRLLVTGVVPLGPAALTREIAAGDSVVAINGATVTARTNLDELLSNTIDRRVVLTVTRAGAAAPREVAIRPTNQATEKGLLYRWWVERNREYVLKGSGGRLGYVHMINMSAAALAQLHIDLDVDNHRLDGVVIDIRNTSGGFVSASALDVFARQPYVRVSTRSVPEAPARAVLGQRALESATVLVTNQHSLSDAESFAEGYRMLKLGTVVGEPTAGWIVYARDARLVDGSTLRLPRMRVRAADGSDMERHPRPVDVEMRRPLGESAAGKDSQLDEAIRVLLKKLGRAE